MGNYDLSIGGRTGCCNGSVFSATNMVWYMNESGHITVWTILNHVLRTSLYLRAHPADPDPRVKYIELTSYIIEL